MTQVPQPPDVQIEISQNVGSGDATGMKIGEIKGSVTVYQTSSVASLSPDYATRIQNFLNEYSGTPEEPVPFGGREQELASLDTWLEDDKAPPYLLLAAPAGRGKSALLVNWNKHLLAKQNIAVVFFPISIRFRTNLASIVFAALTAQLAALHGEKVSGTLNTPVEDWRGIMSGYLIRPLPDGRRLLVIIDGLDEAVDWQAGADLFPSNPLSCLRIVVSARYLAGHKDAVSWLRILGWDRLGLARTPNLLPLTRDGLADVLRKMGCPLDQLGARVDIVRELYRLSEGDPLLVRLYVDDLWKQGNKAIRLRPEDLQGIAPGLDGYFSNWWEYQCTLWGKEAPLKETRVRTFFYLLASCLRPLYQKDLLNLVLPESELTDSLILEETLKPLARLVIGDGRQEGYVFSHPRLGIYFYEKYASDCRKAESRILLLGKQTLEALNQGQMLPQDASPYIVQYYSSHLIRLGCDAETLLSLVSDGWRLAWESLDGTYAGFLNDVEKAWLAAEKADRLLIQDGKQPLYIKDVVRCALCLASVNSLYQDISPLMVETLVEKRIWTPQQGLTYTQRLQNPEQRVKALLKLEPYLPDALKNEAFSTVIEILLTIADNEELPREVLLFLIPLLPESWLPEVLEAIQSISNYKYQAELLIKLAPHLPEAFVPEALRIAQSIKDKEELEIVLAVLLVHLQNPLKPELLAALKKIEIKELSPLVLWLTYAAAFLAVSGRGQEALVAMRRVLLEGENYDYDYDEFDGNDVTKLLGMLALVLFASGCPQEAWEAIQAIRKESERAEVLIELLPNLSASSLLEAIEIIRTIEDQSSKTYVLVELSSHLAEAGCPEAALTTVAEISDEDQRGNTLQKILSALPDSLIPKAIKIIKTIEDELFKANILSELSLHLVEAGCPEAALTTVAEILDENQRSDTLQKILSTLPDSLIPKAIEIIKGIKNEFLKIELWTEIAPYFPLPKLKKLLQAIRKISKIDLRDKLLTKFSLHLVKLGYSQAALEIIKTIIDETQRAEAAAIILAHLPESLMPKAMGLVKAGLALYQKSRQINLADEVDELELATKPALCLSKSWIQTVTAAFNNVQNQNIQAQLLWQFSAALLKSNYFQGALQAVAAISNVDKLNQTLALWIANLPKQAFEVILAEFVSLVLASKQINLILNLLERIKNIENKVERLYRIAQIFEHIIDLGFYKQVDEVIQVISINEYDKRILKYYLIYNFITLTTFKSLDLAWLTYQKEIEIEIKYLIHLTLYFSNHFNNYLYILEILYQSRNYRDNKLMIIAQECLELGLIQELSCIYRLIDHVFYKEQIIMNLLKQSSNFNQIFSFLLEFEQSELSFYRIGLTSFFYRHSPTEVWAAIQAIEDENLRSKLLSYLPYSLYKDSKLEKAAQIVCGKNGCLEEVLAFLRRMPNKYLVHNKYNIELIIFSKVLATFCLRLGALGRLQEAFIVAQLIKDKHLKAELFTKLNLPLQELEIVQDTLAVPSKTPVDNNEQTLMLVSIIKENFSLANLQTIKIENQHEDLLVNQISRLSEPEKENLLREILQQVETIENKDEQDKIIAQLLQYLPEQILQALLETKRQIKDQDWQSIALIKLIPYLPAPLGIDLQRDLLEKIKAIEPENRRGQALVKLACYLPQLRLEALKIAYQIEDFYWQAKAVAGVAFHLNEPLKSNILQKILDTVNASENEVLRGLMLAELVPYLTASQLLQVIEVGKKTQKELVKAVLLKKLSRRLGGFSGKSEKLWALQLIEREDISAWFFNKLAPDAADIPSIDILQEQLETALTYGELSKALELKRLIPNLPQPLLQQALTASLAIQGEVEQSIVLTHILTYLSVLPASEVLETLKANQNQWWRARVLFALLMYLPESLLPEALLILRTIENENLQAKVLEQFIKRLVELGYVQAGRMGLQILRSKDNSTSALANFKIQPLLLLTDETLAQTIQSIEIIPDLLWRVRFLVGIVRHLPDKTEFLEKALTTARAINQQHQRAKALLVVAPHLAETQKSKVLQEALNTSKTIKAELAQRLIEWGYWDEVANTLQSLEDEYERMNTLGKSISAINNLITDNVWEKLLLFVAMIEDAAQRDQVLAELALGLSKLGYLQESLIALQKIEDHQWQAQTLIYIAQYQQEPYRSKLLLKAKDAAEKIRDKGQQVIALIQVGLCLPEVNKAKILKQAVLTLETIKDKNQRSQVLSEVTTRLVAVGYLDQVTTALEEMEAEYSQGNLPQQLQGDIWHKLLLLIRLMQNKAQSAELLFDLASLMSNLQKQELQQEALETALAIDDKAQQALVLMWMASKLTKSNTHEVLYKAMEAIGAIDDETKRTKVLEQLVWQLNSVPLSH